jgi:acyl-homoserine lactone acylase PvdQ
MPRLTKILLITFFVIMVLFFLFSTIAYYWLNRSIPVLKGEQTVQGLADSVAVYRDGTHCPYIEALNTADLCFMQGYITAQDRFFQMDFWRHLAEGRLTVLLGESAAPVDSLIQRINSVEPEDSEEHTDDRRAMVLAYSKGVNAYITKFRKRLPIEYQLLGQSPEPWKVGDCLAVQRLVVTLLCTGEWEDVICRVLDTAVGHGKMRRMFPEYQWNTHDQPAQLKRFTELFDQARRSGYLPVFLSADQVWAVQGASDNGPLLVCSLPGMFWLPGLYYEIFLYCPEMHARGLSIPGIPGILSGQNRSLAWAVYGGGGRVSVDPAGGEAQNRFRRFDITGLMTCGSVTQADSLFRQSQYSGLRWICADTSGKIASGNIDQSGFLVSSWIRERIHELNRTNEPMSIMACQFIQTDNHSVLADHLLPALLPLVSGPPELGEWAGRLGSWDHHMRIGDAEAVVFEWWMRHLCEALFADEMDKTAFAWLMFSPRLWQSAVARCVTAMPEWADDVRTPAKETLRDCAVRSLTAAIRSVRTQQGPDIRKWSWGTEHAVKFSHTMLNHESFRMSRSFGLQQPLVLGPYSLEGCYASVTGISAFASDSSASRGPAARLVMDVRNPDRTLSVLSTGQSGQMIDSHYQDQIPLYTTGYYHPNLFDIKKIKEAGWLKLMVRPEKKQD